MFSDNWSVPALPLDDEHRTTCGILNGCADAAPRSRFSYGSVGRVRQRLTRLGKGASDSVRTWHGSVLWSFGSTQLGSPRCNWRRPVVAHTGEPGQDPVPALLCILHPGYVGGAAAA